MQAKDKVALITGAAHRVGKAIALRLAQHGSHIVLNYRSSIEEARQTQAELEALGVRVLPIQADVSDPAAIEAMVAQAVDHFGRLDILVNSAANFNMTPFPDMTLADWDTAINTNLRGPFWCARTVAPHMLELEEGLIINITDLSAFTPAQDMLAHTVAKAGLVSLTQAMALELRPTIRVNAIAPGPVIPPPEYDQATNERIAQRTLLKRWGSGDHVAQAVIFFVENDYVTGEVVRVDGGELLGWRDGDTF
jgi:NAD(P)-dependent dehydrogenase (short-subunit alcohol dehydrogenase family)